MQFTDDIEYWQSNYFYHPFQKSISFWKWGGTDIKIYGEGILDGNGQAWYDGFAGREILVSGFVVERKSHHASCCFADLLLPRIRTTPITGPTCSTLKTLRISISKGYGSSAHLVGRISSLPVGFLSPLAHPSVT